MNSTYFANMSLVPYDESKLIPDKNIQISKSGHIQGWIDIVGFSNTIKKDSTYYINDNPIDRTILRYEVWGKGSACGYNIKKDVQKYVVQDNVVAIMTIKLIWYTWECGEDSCWCAEHVDRASFYDYEKVPTRYSIPDTIGIEVHEYKDKKTIFFGGDQGITGYNIATQNGSVLEMKAAHLEYTSKNVPYLNFTTPQIIVNRTGQIAPFGSGYIMENTSFSTRFFTPYGEVNVSPNITVTHHAPTSIHPFTFFFIFIIAVFLGGIKRMINLCRV